MIRNIPMMANGNRTLIMRADETNVLEYIVVSNFNPNERDGQQWNSGVYFYKDELLYATAELFGTPSYARLSELATLFKDGLLADDYDEAMIYFEETCEMDESEMEYFGLVEEDE